MMPPRLRPLLLELEARLSKTFAGRSCEVRLFGSYVRGEATEDSDVDVLVLLDRLDPPEIATVADIATGLAIETGIDFAAVPMTRAHWADTGPGRGFVRELHRESERP